MLERGAQGQCHPLVGLPSPTDRHVHASSSLLQLTGSPRDLDSSPGRPSSSSLAGRGQQTSPTCPSNSSARRLVAEAADDRRPAAHLQRPRPSTAGTGKPNTRGYLSGADAGAGKFSYPLAALRAGKGRQRGHASG
jgi:hypothetical protein